MIWSNRKKSGNYIIIVGCGRLGGSIADALSEAGTDVLIMDKNKNAFRKLSPTFGGIAMEGDAMDIQMLTEAQLQKATTLLTVTNDDNTNIMVAQLARQLFHVNHVIARLYDPERDCVYRELGIDTICPAVLSAKEIEKLLVKGKGAAL